MYGEQGFTAVHKMVHLVKFIGKVMLNLFFSRAYITLLSTRPLIGPEACLHESM